jgi:hypothetical protein
MSFFKPIGLLLIATFFSLVFAFPASADKKIVYFDDFDNVSLEFPWINYESSYPGTSINGTNGLLRFYARSNTYADVVYFSGGSSNMTSQVSMMLSDSNAGTGPWAPGLFVYWNAGNWTSIQLDGSGEARAYDMINGSLITNKSLGSIAFGKFYTLSISVNSSTIESRLIGDSPFVFSSFTRKLPAVFRYEPKTIIGKGYDTGSLPYREFYLQNDYIGDPGEFSSVYADNFTQTREEGWDENTAKYLIGKVHIAVIYVSEENNTFPQGLKTSVSKTINQSIDFLKNVAPLAANLSFEVSYREGKTFNESGVWLCSDSSSSCTNNPSWSWCSNWREYVLASLGQADIDGDGKRWDDMSRAVRDSSGADQSVLFYYVGLTRARDCGSKAYALPQENSVFYHTWTVSVDNIVMIHEILHAFGADDEYLTSCDEYSCTRNYGIWGYPNRNCAACSNTSDCLMESTSYNTICNYTRGQIGWGDQDADGILDPVDPEMFIPQDDTSCVMPGKYPPCDVVSLSEIVDAINNWASGHMILSDVIDLINSWADPIGHPPS